MATSRYIALTEIPQGLPRQDQFTLREQSLDPLAEGEVRVRNLWLSVDPYMRGRMSGVTTYVEPYALDAPMDGGAVGEVVASRDQRFASGDLVRHMAGWRDVAQLSADRVEPLPQHEVPPQAYLGVLGMPGMTAWTGLNRIAQMQPGERVLVSAASGAVGSLAVQLALAAGCQVVGVAGSDAKCEWLEGLGAKAVNYRGKDVEALTQALAEAAPEGIDVYYENVGGPLLDAALANLRDHARIAVCGLIDRYNDAQAGDGPRNLNRLLFRKARMEGFIVAEHWAHYPTFLAEVAPRVAAGEVRYRETVVEGLERTPEAFLKLFSGDNEGKMLVRLDASAADV
ncbi:NADP-dependent oxidoreductase [Salinicola endophyticus]|uniref:NADP-dependent oxidoreductase n=1 Tax=Salinicola endophyticus TaxID=1949083 RepID=A0ABY8FIX5_9GAMM|nr:NADP-dependent oxidoreductase [Salinicola endophyticus]WFF42768.1 NADP-dependent oxidoreductase [Salinicola endophyticus]